MNDNHAKYNSSQRVHVLDIAAPLLFVLGILFLYPLSSHEQIGDVIFQWLGLKSWSSGQGTSFHRAIILGILLLLVGMKLTIQIYRGRIPRIRYVVGWSLVLSMGLFSVIYNKL
ncbi:hypothetical protein J2Z69_002660 [Paenibacillus shirakamiensis]|uniref:Uncharacterized protein n=1 Tax=Paenibacillus shirakamiensis TaxID=1265935 RepID=A0ABS4JIT0_9BACL|nr:hypothetical protein [Paenibacillus shirakamiensis]MBP2001615.1 hypothetical protein [Paenibacillus shirakamiensis]